MTTSDKRLLSESEFRSLPLGSRLVLADGREFTLTQHCSNFVASKYSGYVAQLYDGTRYWQISYAAGNVSLKEEYDYIG